MPEVANSQDCKMSFSQHVGHFFLTSPGLMEHQRAARILAHLAQSNSLVRRAFLCELAFMWLVCLQSLDLLVG